MEDKNYKESENYKEMIDELESADPEDYQDLIDDYGYGDLDLLDIINDIGGI